MEIIQGGTAIMHDIDGFLAWYHGLNLAESKDIRQRLFDANPDKGKGYVSDTFAGSGKMVECSTIP